MRLSIHGLLLLVGIFAALPVVGWLVAHAARPPMHPCTIEGEAARCGDITVPENYGEPSGRRIALHAVVLGGRNRGEGREPIFVLAGGPGQAATTLTQGASAIFRSVRGTRDVVLIDQRGTGGPNRLDCARAPRSLLVPADVAGCVARLSQDATLRYYGTDNFLEDLESTRKALGYDRIVLFGLSYGTRAAYAYTRRYTESVRAVVLVGPAPVSMRLLDSVGEDGRRSLDAIVADCLGDQRCSKAFPNVVKDAEHFRTSVGDPFRLLGLQALQYSANTAVLIPKLLNSAAAGDFSPLDSAVAGLREEYLHQPAAQLALGLHLTIACGDRAAHPSQTLSTNSLPTNPTLGDSPTRGLGRPKPRIQQSERPIRDFLLVLWPRMWARPMLREAVGHPAAGPAILRIGTASSVAMGPSRVKTRRRRGMTAVDTLQPTSTGVVWGRAAFQRSATRVVESRIGFKTSDRVRRRRSGAGWIEDRRPRRQLSEGRGYPKTTRRKRRTYTGRIGSSK